MEEKYYFGRHIVYGFKAELSVLPIGICICGTESSPDMISDLEMLR